MDYGATSSGNNVHSKLLLPALSSVQRHHRRRRMLQVRRQQVKVHFIGMQRHRTAAAERGGGIILGYAIGRGGGTETQAVEGRGEIRGRRGEGVLVGGVALAGEREIGRPDALHGGVDQRLEVF